MKTFDSLARRLVLVWGLAAGCASELGGPEPTPTSSPPASSETATGTAPVVDVAAVDAVITGINRDLARLKQLDVVSIGWLVVRGPDASSCYVHPCQAAETDPVLAAEYARQAPRLHAVADMGEAIATVSAELPPATDTAADLTALQALQLVDQWALVTVAQPTTGNCYSLPCPDDVAAIKTENARRAAVLHALAVEAPAAGL